MAVSVFDLFKIGIGPSSSHTVGPMRAARRFALLLRQGGLLGAVTRVRVELYGSLGATGKGHGSDKAVLLGLAGHEPDSVDVDRIDAILADIRASGRLALLDAHPVVFTEKADLLFYATKSLPFHANGMRFTAYGAGADATPTLAERTYYSVGGGFVVSDEVAGDDARQKRIAPDAAVLPLPFHSGDELLQQTRQLRLQHRRGGAAQRTPLARRRADACRPAQYLAGDAGLRRTRLSYRGRLARWLRGQAPRGGFSPGAGARQRRGGARPAAGHGLGQSVRPGRQRGERRRRPRRHCADQRRGRHHPRRAALLHAFRAGRRRRRHRRLPADRRGHRHPVQGERLDQWRRGRLPGGGRRGLFDGRRRACARFWAARPSRWRTPPRSAWSTILA